MTDRRLFIVVVLYVFVLLLQVDAYVDLLYVIEWRVAEDTVEFVLCFPATFVCLEWEPRNDRLR